MRVQSALLNRRRGAPRPHLSATSPSLVRRPEGRMDRQPPPLAVDILSDDDSPSPPRSKKRAPPPLLVIVDDPTPQKPNPTRTPSFVAETPLSLASDASIVRCSLARSDPGSSRPPLPDKFAGITGLICLESDNESEGTSNGASSKKMGTMDAEFELTLNSEMCSNFSRPTSPLCTGSEKDYVGLNSPTKQVVTSSNDRNNEVIPESTTHCSFDGWRGTTDLMHIVDCSPHDDLSEDVVPQLRSFDDEEHSISRLADIPAKRKGKTVAGDADKTKLRNEEVARKKQLKEEKNRLNEERKRKRQQDKLLKESLKAEAAERKKLEKEKQKWGKGKFATKSIVAEIDSKVVENGSVGGNLLTKLAEKSLSFRITSNPIERSILWKMNVPDQIAQVSSVGAEVPYVLLVFQAEEFCHLVNSESFIDHVHRVRGLYPSFTICYLTNKLMSYVKKCEQNHYKNPSNVSWRRPPVEEVLSKLTTHFTKTHSRQCLDEAELAEHIVGLTFSLANCQFRKKLTWLSVNANGSIIPKDFIDRKLIKKNVWLKALVAIPKVQPRYAVAIWKKYPTMRSLLNVYMDQSKSVHEKEFLLKDLMIEGLLGNEDRRLGEMCSKRVYRILMAQSGGINTDEIEDGADFFRS